MRLSVVINTYNRASSLRRLLDALRYQHHPDFEVVVVNGPSDDGTAELLAGRSGELRVVACPERHLARSRNLGIDAAAGDVVAFIDDDAVPEPRWLADLAAAYADPAVGGAGGLTLDHTGVYAQYRYAVCDRIGRPDYDRRPPFDAENRPGADPFLYLQGTNCSFRRTVLEAVGGFDEEIEYNYDETEVCVSVLDAGHRLAALAGAVVHHHFLPSHLRDDAGFTDPFAQVKNRAYFAFRLGGARYDRSEIMRSLTDYVEHLAGAAGDPAFTARAQEGLAVGVRRGEAGQRRGRALAERDAAAFHPYPVFDPPGGPRPAAFVEQTTAAREHAAAGREAHLLVRDDARGYRVDFEDGVWVHRFPVARRWIPELAGAPEREALERDAAVRAVVARIRARSPQVAVHGIDEPDAAALGERHGLPRAAAERLLDPARFPVDVEAGLRVALVADDAGFVDGVYRTLFGRPAEADAHRDYGSRIAHRPQERLGVLREAARSGEARARDVDPRVVDALPDPPPPPLARVVGAAWLLDDDAAFAAALRDALGVPAGPEPHGDRAALARALLARPEVTQRVGAPELALDTLRTERQIVAGLRRLRAEDDRAFVAGVYALLLGRDPDPDGAGAFVAQLGAGAERASVTRAVATSAEAAARGLTDPVAERIAATVEPRAGRAARALRRLRAPSG